MCKSLLSLGGLLYQGRYCINIERLFLVLHIHTCNDIKIGHPK